MTTTLYIILLIAFILSALNLMPTADVSSLTTINDAIFYFVKILKGWNWLFAIDSLLIAFGIIITYELAIWSWFNIMSPLIKVLRGGTN